MMNSVFKKLNFKDQKEICILQAPDSFKPAMKEMETVTKVKTRLSAAKEIDFVLAFVTKQSEVDTFAKQILSLVKGDGIVWFAYPKGSSKKYRCEFNRDTGWTVLGQLGFEGVRMVAIDEDWSALRFRNAQHIKTMTRSFAMSDEGKRKVAAKKRAKPLE
jgi:hypothetical protein